MKTAISHWQGRIAPVFDVATLLRIVESEGGGVQRLTEVTLDPELTLAKRADQLGDLGIEVLVCGAISRPFQTMIASQGIEIVPFVAGELEQVIAAHLEGRLATDSYAMPGCWGRGGGRCGAGRGGGRGMGQGGGRGGGRGMGQGGGRGGGQGMGQGGGRGGGQGMGQGGGRGGGRGMGQGGGRGGGQGRIQRGTQSDDSSADS